MQLKLANIYYEATENESNLSKDAALSVFLEYKFTKRLYTGAENLRFCLQ